MKFPAKDLPLYTEFPDPKFQYEYIPNKRGYLECVISPYRRSAQQYFTSLTRTKSKVEEYYCEGSQKIAGAVNTLQSNPNIILKTGVITISGLGGIVIGHKGGYFRKFLYMIIGAGTAGGLIFPQHAICGLKMSMNKLQDQYNKLANKMGFDKKC